MTTETKELKVYLKSLPPFEVFPAGVLLSRPTKVHWETYDEKKGSSTTVRRRKTATTVAEIVQSELSYWHTL